MFGEKIQELKSAFKRLNLSPLDFPPNRPLRKRQKLKTILAVTASVFLFGYLTFLLAADRPQVMNVKKLKDTVRVSTGEEIVVTFKRDGNQLLQPSQSKGSCDQKEAIKVKLALTSASPVPPPREGATRPYLEVINEYEKTLHFRVLVRMNGSKEFVELPEDVERIPAGEAFYKCWEFDSLVEEAVLHEFKLSDQPGE